MAVAFHPNQRNRGPPHPAQIQKMLDENSQLIQAIMDAQSKGKAQESVHFQNLLHKNLTYLASLADPNQNLATVIPPPQTLEQATSLLNGPNSQRGNLKMDVPGGPPQGPQNQPQPPQQQQLQPQQPQYSNNPMHQINQGPPNSGPPPSGVPQPGMKMYSNNGRSEDVSHQKLDNPGSQQPPQYSNTPMHGAPNTGPPTPGGGQQNVRMEQSGQSQQAGSIPQQYSGNPLHPSGHGGPGSGGPPASASQASMEIKSGPQQAPSQYSNQFMTGVQPPSDRNPPPMHGPPQPPSSAQPPPQQQAAPGYRGYNQAGQYQGYGSNYGPPTPGPSPSPSSGYASPGTPSNVGQPGGQSRPPYNQQGSYGHFSAHGPAGPMGSYQGYDQSGQNYPGYAPQQTPQYSNPPLHGGHTPGPPPPSSSAPQQSYSGYGGYNQGSQFPQSSYGSNYGPSAPGPSPSPSGYASPAVPTSSGQPPPPPGQPRPGYNQPGSYGHFSVHGPTPMSSYQGYDQPGQNYSGYGPSQSQ